MRSRVLAVAWVGLGILIGTVATGMLARRWGASWSRDEDLFDRLDRVATGARVLAALDLQREAEARDVLERELTFSLELADQLAAGGASVLFLPLAAGDLIGGLGQAEAYARSHQLDAAVADRAHRLRQRLCDGLSPQSKYRGLCE